MIVDLLVSLIASGYYLPGIGYSHIVSTIGYLSCSAGSSIRRSITALTPTIKNGLMFTHKHNGYSLSQFAQRSTLRVNMVPRTVIRKRGLMKQR